MAKVPLRIFWRWKEKSGVFEDDPKADPETWNGYLHEPDWQLHWFWWFEGNGSCDCNRKGILGLLTPEEASGEVDIPCGEEIIIDRIEAIGIEGVAPLT